MNQILITDENYQDFEQWEKSCAKELCRGKIIFDAMTLNAERLARKLFPEAETVPLYEAERQGDALSKNGKRRQKLRQALSRKPWILPKRFLRRQAI